MKLIPGKIALEWAAKFLEENNSNHTPVVAIIPGGGASWGRMSYRKRWSTENFAKVAGALSAKGCFILAGGDNTERALCAKVMGKVKGACSIVTDLPIELYVALLSRCDLVLCNDGGPLHIAASMGVKTVSIFGPVDDKVYGPYPPDKRHRVVTASDVECRPCYRRFKVPECHNDSKCLRNIHVDEVKKACEDLLGIKRKAIEGPEGRQIREREQGAGGDR
jgi:ADP-heptose:LPS heptosyltransferase